MLSDINLICLTFSVTQKLKVVVSVCVCVCVCVCACAITGDDVWPTGCSLRFIAGTHMSSVDRVLVPCLRPGCSHDVVLNLKSPAEGGVYKAQWHFSTFTGILFGGSRCSSCSVSTLFVLILLLLFSLIFFYPILSLLNLFEFIYPISFIVCLQRVLHVLLLLTINWDILYTHSLR